MRLLHHRAWMLLLFLLPLPATAAEPGSAQLTLEAALASADTRHPDLQLAEAERDIALADRSAASARTDASVNLEGILRSGSQPSWTNDFAPDNSLRLTARKTLYDFGRSSASEAAAQSELNAREADLLNARDRRRLDVMARFFDVLLADLQFAADNELMAVYYVNFDQGRDKLERGQISAVELAELEARYQDALLKRNTSAQRQRISRALLANAMNRPGELPGELADPRLAGNQRPLPDYAKLLPILDERNPRLRAQRELLLAAQQRMEAARADKGPTLDAELQAADYSRPAVTRDHLSAGLILNWPLYQGERTDSRVAREQAQFYRLQAGTEKLHMELNQALLETCLEITQLQGNGRQAAQKNADYRDMVLERSRGLYELELKSNLGTSMVDTAEANLRTRRTEYQLALAWARLDALLGNPDWNNLKEDKK